MATWSDLEEETGPVFSTLRCTETTINTATLKRSLNQTIVQRGPVLQSKSSVSTLVEVRCVDGYRGKKRGHGKWRNFLDLLYSTNKVNSLTLPSMSLEGWIIFLPRSSRDNLQKCQSRKYPVRRTYDSLTTAFCWVHWSQTKMNTVLDCRVTVHSLAKMWCK